MSEPCIHISSILEELTLHDSQVDELVLGERVVEIFDQCPSLPGVVIKHQGQLQGMISRQRFLEALSRAYGRELFLRRPLAVMQGFMPRDALVMSGTTLITAAAELAIARPVETLNEPLVVRVSANDYYLLDVHDLLIAQSRIHQLTSELLQQKTRAEMMHTEKLASLGKLLAGLAHEVRNPVNFIAGNLHYLEGYCQDLQWLIQAYQREQPHPSAELQNLLTEVDLDFVLEDFPKVLSSIANGTDRLKGLVNSLRTFARIDDNEWGGVDIHPNIEGTLLILSNRLKSGIRVIKDYGHLPELQGYPSQLGQVFMNILSNAIDALLEQEAKLSSSEITLDGREPDHVGVSMVSSGRWQPEIHIKTRCLAELPGSERSHPSHSGQWISIRIRDNGPGIPADIQPKIFEDFFTTKPAEEGTGLGLPIAAKIVEERHQGYLKLTSPCIFNQGEGARGGTEFEILLPVMNQQAPPEKH